MSKVSTAVAQQKNTGPLATMEQHRAELALVLPSHINAESWYASTRAALQRDADLMASAQANPQSLVDVLHDAARLGLQPGTDEYYITWRTIKGTKTVQGQAGYQGEVELIYRAGAVSSVKCELVYSGDTFDWRPGEMDRPRHETGDWFADRGQVRGAYAYAIMKDTGATSRVVIIDQTRIKRAMVASTTCDANGVPKDTSPWKTDYGAMVLKTAAHDLQKWVPTSAEYRREELRAARDVAAEVPTSQRTAVTSGATPGAPSDSGPADVIEGEVVDPAPEGPAMPTGDQRMSNDQQKLLFELLRQAEVGNGKAYVSNLIDRDVQSWARVTADEANLCIANLRAIIAGDDEPPAEPVDPPADAAADDTGDQAAGGDA